MRPLLFIFCFGLLLSVTGLASAQPNVTSYARMTAQLKADAAQCPLLRVGSLGKAAGGHKDLWLVRAADPASDPAQTIRILILCRQHGDEPASTEAVLGLLHRLAGGGDSTLRQSLSHVTLYFIPMVNPDGADVNARSNALGADLNRDWGVFHQPETRAVARAAQILRPNLVIDAHNWDGNDEYDADCLEIPREMETPLGKTAHALQQNAVRALAVNGYQLHPTAWGVDADPRLAHRWFAGRHILSALVETHYGAPTDSGDFERRQGLYAALIEHLAAHYAGASTQEKPQLDGWEGGGAATIRDGELFPLLDVPVKTLRVAGRSHFPASRLWLWAIGVYGLALWGAGTRTVSGDKRRTDRSFAKTGYYSLTRKCDGTETKVRSGQRKAVSNPPR